MRCAGIRGMLEEAVIVTANVAYSKRYFKGLTYNYYYLITALFACIKCTPVRKFRISYIY